jgi:Domain of unknown function (DUF4419)
MTMGIDYTASLVYGFEIDEDDVQRIWRKSEKDPGEFHMEDRFDPKTGKKIKQEKVWDRKPSTKSWYEMNGKKIDDLDFEDWDSFLSEHFGCNVETAGWCNVLFPYLTDSKAVLRENRFAKNWSGSGGFADGPGMDAYPNSVSSTPFKWQIGMGTYDMAFLGGLVGTHQHEDLSIEPAIGWAVLDKKSFKNEPINVKEDW